MQGAFAVEKAENRPLTEDMITARLMKLGGTVFDVREEDVRIETDQDIMIPVSVINSMRRGVAEELADALRGEARKNRRPLTEEKIGEAVEGEKLGDDSEVRRVESLAAEEGSDDKMPSLPWVTKGEADRYIEENFEALAEGARERGKIKSVINVGVNPKAVDIGDLPRSEKKTTRVFDYRY